MELKVLVKTGKNVDEERIQAFARKVEALALKHFRGSETTFSVGRTPFDVLPEVTFDPTRVDLNRRIVDIPELDQKLKNNLVRNPRHGRAYVYLGELPMIAKSTVDDWQRSFGYKSREGFGVGMYHKLVSFLGSLGLTLDMTSEQLGGWVKPSE